ncbi:MAG: hypothetical protein HDR25_04430, partial [Lachnospiraceae bacterium]|nr:hypothetical protein [Lachnospiraceae bacterium]
DGTEIAKSEDGKSYNDSLYDVYVANGTEVGKATVTVTAKTIVPPAEAAETPSSGDDAAVTTPTAVYAGSKTVPFTIKSAPIKLDNIVFVSREKNEDGTNKTSTGKAITLPDLDYTGAARAQAGEFKVVIDGVEFDGVAKGSRNVNDLDPDTMLYKYNYTYEYKNNVEAGTANIVIKGIHNCTGSAALKFKINPKPVAEADIKKCTKAYTETKDGATVAVPAVKMEGKGLEIVYDYDVTYVSSGAKPTISVYYNGNGVSKKNYGIAYKNNKNAGDQAQAIITWNGGLKGTPKTTLDYVISKCKFEDNVYAKSISDVFTNGKASMKASEFDKSKAVIMNGKTRLANNRDYTLEFEYDEYNANLEAVTEEVEENGTKVTKQKRVVYDASNKDAKKNEVYVPQTGLDVEVYIKPVTGGKFDNYESTDGGRVKVADIRVAYFDIAKASIKLIDDATGKNAILYFKDVTELTTINSSGINCLDQKYVKIAHSAYAKSEYFKADAVDKDGYLLYTKYATRLDKKAGDGYTYDVNATDAVKAGTQKVTFYGTGLFGGSKVFRYKLEKKSYNISKAVVDTKTGIYIASDAYLAGGEITKEVKAQLEDQLTKALEGRITAVNGSPLLPGYFTCTYGKDIENCKSGKAITVTIKGANSYSGSKTVKIMATLISDNIGKATASSVAAEVAKDAIAGGVELGEEKDPLNVAMDGKISISGRTLVYGVDYTVNDAEYTAFATDENGAYIVDASGETMIGEDGEVVTDEGGTPIKFKVLRKYTGYYNNKAVCTEEAPAYVCIKGIGGFSGVLEVAFTIAEAQEQSAQ